MVKSPTKIRTFEALIEIVAQLRGPQGCPWDKEQTHQSLTPFVLEEAFEVVEAIETPEKEPSNHGGSKIPNPEKLKEELGDLLFQVILHAQLASERGDFNIEDIIESLNKKMLRRHPHVFGNETAETPKEVLENWEKIKSSEETAKTLNQNTIPNPFSNIPIALPSLQQAHKIGNKTQLLKFDWQQPQEVWCKVEEELEELRSAWLVDKSISSIEHELGDVYFSLAQWARHLGLDPEKTTRLANRRFISRFTMMLEVLYQSNPQSQDLLKTFTNLSPSEKEELWLQAKIKTQNS